MKHHLPTVRSWPSGGRVEGSGYGPVGRFTASSTDRRPVRSVVVQLAILNLLLTLSILNSPMQPGVTRLESGVTWIAPVEAVKLDRHMQVRVSGGPAPNVCHTVIPAAKIVKRNFGFIVGPIENFRFQIDVFGLLS
jgi:hypothetical protein